MEQRMRGCMRDDARLYELLKPLICTMENEKKPYWVKVVIVHVAKKLNLFPVHKGGALKGSFFFVYLTLYPE